jgi:hypothetical protein
VEEYTNEQFNFQQLYREPIRMEGLIDPITKQDIRQVIANKAPGSNRFTGEFYKTFLELLMSDFIQVYNLVLQNPQVTLEPLNGGD